MSKCYGYVSVNEKYEDDGSKTTKFVIKPSIEGAVAGLVAGGKVGSAFGPLGTTIGAVGGGTIGFIFGP